MPLLVSHQNKSSVALSLPLFSRGLCGHSGSLVCMAGSRRTEGPCIGADMLARFLHEWRRCVCRSCTSHLSRVKKELLDRLRITRKDQSNPTPTKKQHNKTQNECNL